MYTHLYISSVDENGRTSKPFLLPQRNPWEYYHGLFNTYNIPDFSKTKVKLDIPIRYSLMSVRRLL